MHFIKVLPGLALGIALTAGVFAPARAADQPATMGTGAGSYMEAAFKQFDAHVAECTKKTGYDPDNTSNLGKHEIAPEEDKWRACAYQGVETILIPATGNPVMYTTLIQTHKIMTDNIRRKASTRAERKRQIEDLVQDIEFKEIEFDATRADSPEKGTQTAQAMDTDRMRDMVDSLRMP